MFRASYLPFKHSFDRDGHTGNHPVCVVMVVGENFFTFFDIFQTATRICFTFCVEVAWVDQY